MSYRLEFELLGLPETTNQVLSMRLKWRLRRKVFWKRQVAAALKALPLPPAPLEHARLTLTRCSVQRPDPDGLTSTFKHLIDALVIGKVLVNDRHKNIGFPRYRHEKAGYHAGKVRILVEEISAQQLAKENE